MTETKKEISKMKRNVACTFPAALAMSVIAFAQQQSVITTCTTPNGATVNGASVSAMATFNPSQDSIHVTVMNSLSNPQGVSQNISSVAFTLSTGQTTGTLEASFARSLLSVQNGGAPVSKGIFQPTGWALAENFNGGFQLCVLCNSLGSIGPSHTLIGPPAASGKYDAANGSITSNPHNPFTAGLDIFSISVPGVTSATTITNAVFGFSTQVGVTVTGVCKTNYE
jgi:hypothetical protein